MYTENIETQVDILVEEHHDGCGYVNTFLLLRSLHMHYNNMIEDKCLVLMKFKCAKPFNSKRRILVEKYKTKMKKFSEYTRSQLEFNFNTILNTDNKVEVRKFLLKSYNEFIIHLTDGYNNIISMMRKSYKSA